jgi:hypothetical protein
MVINAQTKKSTFIPCNFPPWGNFPTTTHIHPLKVQFLSPTKMVNNQIHVPHYNCDEKYAPSHRCKEHNLLQIDMTTQDLTNHTTAEVTPKLQVEDTKTQTQANIKPPLPLEVPLISLHELLGISIPQALKFTRCIKHQKFVVIVDSGGTHNFIHKRVVEEIHYFVHLVHNFQIMIAKGGIIKCGDRCENFKLQIGDYQLKNHIFSIDMGCCDIVLWGGMVTYLRTYYHAFQIILYEFH